MADYCNVRSSAHGGGSGSSAASALGTFRAAPATAFHHHPHRGHHTLLRTGGQTSSGGPPSVDRLVGTLDGGGSTQRVRIVRLARPLSFGSHHFPPTGGNFGFSIRGGLEYGTGFFVSAIEKDSEADRQGLRVGDQIVRVNGYQVDDAVHRELAQFVANQERLVLKVRSVGILPVKERSVDPLTWHVVSSTLNGNGKHRDDSRTSCSSNSSASSSSGGTLEELPPGRDLKVILSVAPRTKLGCGICKGPEWKPGIFVQFTKEGGVAREAGLRPGDQILSCNGREFADITFAEAVSIMKASHVLELVIRPGAGIDMFPGESSGYNSSASSVNGDQSPCWGDSTAKRLSIVREESISNDQRRQGKDRDHRGSREKLGPKSSGTSGSRRNNTTIIEFSENGTVVNSSLLADKKKPSEEPKDICYVSKQSETKTIIVEVHRSASTTSVPVTNGAGGSSTIPPPPPLFADKIPPPPPPSSGLSSGYSTTNSGKSGGLGGNRQQRSPSAVSLADSSASSGIDCGPGGGLGNAISEELKRRAAQKQASSSTANPLEPAAALTELENRLKEKRLRPVSSMVAPPGSDAARHSALMDEFKAVHKRMFKNGFDNAELKRAPSKDKLPIDTAPPASSHRQVTANGGSSAGSTTKGTMGRVAATEMAKASGDIAELESIESFKLTNPTPTPVRPPSYYFCPQGTGPATMKKSQKPIAVTISEYSSQTQQADGRKGIGNLKHELEKTLSLSNLRQRSESRENLVERIQINGHAPDQVKLCRSSSVANVGGGGGCSRSSTAVSNGNRITIAISNSADKKK